MEKMAKNRLPGLSGISQTKTKQSEYLEKVFLTAARTGDSQKLCDVLQRLDLNKVNLNVKERNTDNTPLMVAAECGHEKVLSVLLSCGSDVTLRNAAGHTALDLAPERIKQLVLDAVNRQGAGQTLLWQASWQGNAAAVKKILNLNPNLNINRKNSEGLTPLLLVTRDLDLFDQIQQQVFSENYNPTEVVSLLLHQNADCTVVDDEGRSAMHLTARNHGTNARNIISLLARKESLDVDVRDHQQHSALHFASETGDPNVLLALIDNGADVNARGPLGRTPLHITASRGDEQTSGLLVRHGANIFLVDDLGFTPADLAKGDSVQVLLKEAWSVHTQQTVDSLRIKSAPSISSIVKLGHLDVQDIMNKEEEKHQLQRKSSNKYLKKLRCRSHSEEQQNDVQSSDLSKRTRSYSSGRGSRSSLDIVQDIKRAQQGRILPLPPKSSPGCAKEDVPRTDVVLRHNKTQLYEVVGRAVAKVSVLNIDLGGSKFQKHKSKSCGELPFNRYRVQRLSKQRAANEIPELHLDDGLRLQGRSLSAVSLSSYDTLPCITPEVTDTAGNRNLENGNDSERLSQPQIVMPSPSDKPRDESLDDHTADELDNKDVLSRTFNTKDKPVFWFPLVENDSKAFETGQASNHAFFIDLNNVEVSLPKCRKCGAKCKASESEYSRDALCFACHQKSVEKNCFWVPFDGEESNKMDKDSPDFDDRTVLIDGKTLNVTQSQNVHEEEVEADIKTDAVSVEEDLKFLKDKKTFKKSNTDLTISCSGDDQTLNRATIRTELDKHLLSKAKNCKRVAFDGSGKASAGKAIDDSLDKKKIGTALNDKKLSCEVLMLRRAFSAWKTYKCFEPKEYQEHCEPCSKQGYEVRGRQHKLAERQEKQRYVGVDQGEHQEQRFRKQRKGLEQQGLEKEGKQQEDGEKTLELSEERSRERKQKEMCEHHGYQRQHGQNDFNKEQELEEYRRQQQNKKGPEEPRKNTVDKAKVVDEGNVVFFDDRCREHGRTSMRMTENLAGLLRNKDSGMDAPNGVMEPPNNCFMRSDSEITPHEVIIVNPFPTPEPPKMPTVNITWSCQCDRFTTFAKNTGIGMNRNRKGKGKKNGTRNQKFMEKNKKGIGKKNDEVKNEIKQPRKNSASSKRKKKSKSTDNVPVKEISVNQTNLKGDSFVVKDELEILNFIETESSQMPGIAGDGGSLPVRKETLVKGKLTVLNPTRESSRRTSTDVESIDVRVSPDFEAAHDEKPDSEELPVIPRLSVLAKSKLWQKKDTSSEETTACSKRGEPKVQVPHVSGIFGGDVHKISISDDSTFFGAISDVSEELEDIIQEILEETEELKEKHGNVFDGAETQTDTNCDVVTHNPSTKSVSNSGHVNRRMREKQDRVDINKGVDDAATHREARTSTTFDPAGNHNNSAKTGTHSTNAKSDNCVNVASNFKTVSNATSIMHSRTASSLNSGNDGLKPDATGHDVEPICQSPQGCSDATLDNVSSWLLENRRPFPESRADITVDTKASNSSCGSSSSAPWAMIADVSSDYSTLSEDIWDDTAFHDGQGKRTRLEHWSTSSSTISTAGNSTPLDNGRLPTGGGHVHGQPLDLLFTGNEGLVHSRLSRRKSDSSLTPSSEVTSGEEEEIFWKKGNVLGRGAFGTVWCGLTNTGQMIAVKQVELITSNMEQAERQYEKLQEEVALLKSLRHENVVSFLGTCLDGGVVNIFMQFVPGGSIASILARFGPLEESVFQYYTKQIVVGVDYLHHNNVVHRDIKGGNIMLMPTGVIKLIDFGCAKRLYMNMSHSQGDLLRSMRGTPYWMAPEVIRETGYGRKSDVWSVGCTVFEMATGKPPWSHLPPMAAIFAIGKGSEAPALSEQNSEDARNFVSCSMKRHPDDRWSAEELLQHPFIIKCEHQR